jgi:hypothetical protein
MGFPERIRKILGSHESGWRDVVGFVVIIAWFFFAGESKSAPRSATIVTNQLPAKTVKDVMYPRAKMFSIQGPASAVNLVETLQSFERAGMGNRVPILDSSGVPLYVIHRSTIDKFLAAKALESPTQQIWSLTVQDMLEDPALKSILELSFTTLSETATLADAKSAIDAFEYFQGVFVTKGGTRDEPVIGILAEHH